jgi:hypothetical protein
MCSAGCSSRVQEVLKKYPNGRLDEEIQSLIGGNGSLPE